MISTSMDQKTFTLSRVRPEEAEFSTFLSVPRAIFPYYKRQIEQKNQYHPEFFHHGLILKQGEEILGRVALYNNPALKVNGKPAVCLGNYECVRNEAAASFLLEAAEEQARELGKSFLLGPMNGSIWNDYGLISKGANPNFFLEPYNPLYYNDQFARAGFESVATYVSGMDHDLAAAPEQVKAKEDEFIAEGVQFRNIDPENYPLEMRNLYRFAMKSLQVMPFFTPISWEVFRDLFGQLEPWVEPGLVQIAENPAGEVIGCFFCIPDFLNPDERVLIARTVVRSPEPQWRGLGEVLMLRMYREAYQQGYDAMMHAFMPATYGITELSRLYAGTAKKEYTLYGKKI